MGAIVQRSCCSLRDMHLLTQMCQTHLVPWVRPRPWGFLGGFSLEHVAAALALAWGTRQIQPGIGVEQVDEEMGLQQWQ